MCHLKHTAEFTPRPAAVGVALPDLAAGHRRDGIGQTGNRGPMASQGLAALLVTMCLGPAADSAVQCPMFVVATATFRLLYALIVLSLDRRRVVQFRRHPKSHANLALAPDDRGLSLRSAVNAWITLSSSTSVTCAAYCRAIFNIIMTPERISRSTRIAGAHLLNRRVKTRRVVHDSG